MRLFNKYTICWLLGCMIATACVKDNSSLDLTPVNELYIDTDGTPVSFEIQQTVSVLTISPNVVYEGESDLSYTWLLYDQTGAFVDTIGTEKELSTTISRPATTQSSPYTVELQVTENSTGLRAFMRYALTVTSPLPYGWLVLYETATGQQSDVALIRSTEIIKNLQADVVIKDLYATANDGPLPGKPVEILSNNTVEMIFTEQTGVRVNRSDYARLQDFNELFVGEAPTARPEGVMRFGSGAANLVNNGRVYWQYAGSFMSAVSADSKGYQPVAMSYDLMGTNGGFFDKLNRRFLFLEYNTGQASNYVTAKFDNEYQARFSLNDIGKDLIYIGNGFGGQDLGMGMGILEPNKYAIFEDPNKSKRWLYGVSFFTPERPDLCQIDISHLPDIFQLKFADFGTVGPTAFYATDTKLYNFTYSATSNSVSSAKVGFTVPTGEEITCIKLFTQTGSGFLESESKLNKLMFLSTYNEASEEGKVYILGVNPVDGTITTSPLKEYSGFGRIAKMTLKAN